MPRDEQKREPELEKAMDQRDQTSPASKSDIPRKRHPKSAKGL
jgi:hypothetical protein